VDLEWDFPDVVLGVVDANSQHRRIPLDDLTSARQRLGFKALDVHLNVGGMFAC